jgi:hypothetical protein
MEVFYYQRMDDQNLMALDLAFVVVMKAEQKFFSLCFFFKSFEVYVRILSYAVRTVAG